MKEQSPPKPHHHGDLRNALVQAGVSLLAEGGTDALTLRKCAARAGVSHAAPAHHFDGLTGLKAAIAHEGLTRFRIHMLRAADAADQSPRARLKGICCGYLNFAVENPALFDLIFGFDARAIAERGLKEDNTLAYHVLRDACAPFVPAGADPTIVESQVWSLIHGYTTLYLSGRFQGGGTDTDGSFDLVMTLLDQIGAHPAA